MRFKRALKAAALGLSLALSSCSAPKRINSKPKMPLVEKTKRQVRHPCEKGRSIPGGLKTDSYILLQIHRDELHQDITPEAVQSQLLIYRVLGELFAKYDVEFVLLEGLDRHMYLGKTREDKKYAALAKNFHAKCVQMFESDLHKKGYKKPWKKGVRDLCLMRLLALRSNKYLYLMLAHDNPSTTFAGFERNTKEWQAFKKLVSEYQKLMKQLEDKAIADPDFAARLFSKSYAQDDPDIQRGRQLRNKLLENRKFLVEKRSEIAVEEVLSHAGQNTALVIGRAHEDSMRAHITKTPRSKRPTFHFLPPDCRVKSEYLAPPKELWGIINLFKSEAQMQ